MKVTITNVEIENYISLISNENSFRNNITIKVPFDMDWALRVNLKTMTERYAIFQEACNEIGQEYIKAGKVDGDNNRVKEEFIPEFNERMTALAFQKNELEFLPVKKDDFKNLALSMPERDFLMLMVDMDAEETKED